MTKIHEIRTRINTIRKEDKQPLMEDWDDMAAFINNRWPGEFKGKKKFYSCSIADDKAKEIVQFFTQNIGSSDKAKKVPKDFDEHIYLYLPNISKIYVPRMDMDNLSIKEKRQIGPGAYIEVQANPHYRTVDLYQYKNQFNSEFTMRRCADYILRTHKNAVELNLDQYNRAHNITHERTASNYYKNPQELKKEEKEAREKIDTFGLKTK